MDDYGRGLPAPPRRPKRVRILVETGEGSIFCYDLDGEQLNLSVQKETWTRAQSSASTVEDWPAFDPRDSMEDSVEIRVHGQVRFDAHGPWATTRILQSWPE